MLFSRLSQQHTAQVALRQYAVLLVKPVSRQKAQNCIPIIFHGHILLKLKFLMMTILSRNFWLLFDSNIEGDLCIRQYTLLRTFNHILRLGKLTINLVI